MNYTKKKVSNAEIVLIRNCFYDVTGGEELMTFSAFFNAFRKKHKKLNLQGTKSFCKQLFSKMDLNENGFISLSDFVQMLHILLKGPIEARNEGLLSLLLLLLSL